MSYFVYIVACADTTYYTGVTTDIVRRLREHNAPTKGAKYTRTRQPVELRYYEEQPDRSAAQKREYVLRRLSRTEKERIITNKEHGHV